MFRTTAAGVHGKGARQTGPVIVSVSETFALHHIPVRERERVQISNSRTLDDSAHIFAVGYSNGRLFRLTDQGEVCSVGEEFG